MRTLILTLTITNPNWVMSNKITIIKFFRAITALGLKESKDLIEATVARDMGTSGMKFHFRFDLNKKNLGAILSLNNSNNSLAGMVVEVYEAPKIIDLREGYYPRHPLGKDADVHRTTCDCEDCRCFRSQTQGRVSKAQI